MNTTHVLEDDPRVFPTNARFDHPMNVQVGLARIIFAEACTPLHAAPCERGWVLPGGTRTTNRAVALLAAERIDRALVTGYLTTPA